MQQVQKKKKEVSQALRWSVINTAAQKLHVNYHFYKYQHHSNHPVTLNTNRESLWFLPQLWLSVCPSPSLDIRGVKSGDTQECWLNSGEVMALICSVMNSHIASMWRARATIPQQLVFTSPSSLVSRHVSWLRPPWTHLLFSLEVKPLHSTEWSSVIMVWWHCVITLREEAI